jgi:hypothetical protein
MTGRKARKHRGIGGNREGDDELRGRGNIELRKASRKGERSEVDQLARSYRIGYYVIMVSRWDNPCGHKENTR